MKVGDRVVVTAAGLDSVEVGMIGEVRQITNPFPEDFSTPAGIRIHYANLSPVHENAMLDGVRVRVAFDRSTERERYESQRFDLWLKPHQVGVLP